MSDLDLLKKFQKIDRRGAGTKLSMLKELKNKISTDLLILQLRTDPNNTKETTETLMQSDLEHIDSCVKIYEDGFVLNAEAMLKVNEINKRYRRIR